MTAHNHLKQLMCARMEKTGERNSAARRSVIVKADQPTGAQAQTVRNL